MISLGWLGKEWRGKNQGRAIEEKEEEERRTLCWRCLCLCLCLCLESRQGLYIHTRGHKHRPSMEIKGMRARCELMAQSGRLSVLVVALSAPADDCAAVAVRIWNFSGSVWFAQVQSVVFFSADDDDDDWPSNQPASQSAGGRERKGRRRRRRIYCLRLWLLIICLCLKSPHSSHAFASAASAAAAAATGAAAFVGSYCCACPFAWLANVHSYHPAAARMSPARLSEPTGQHSTHR